MSSEKKQIFKRLGSKGSPKLSKQGNSESEEGGSEVQTIYGDLVTFVMMLFILLFVLAYNEKNNAKFITELQIKFGEKIEEKQETLTTDVLLTSKIQHYIDKEKLDEYTQIVVDEYRVKIILSPPILFDSGKAEIKKEGIRVLNGVADIFRSVINPIQIEGHTDNVPINTEQFASNWELSFARSFEVIKYFIYRENFSPLRLSSLGYGEYKPLIDNTTRVNRSKNRRIEINVIRLSETESEDV